MNRRDFLKYTAGLGLALGTGGKISFAASGGEHYFVLVNASGGWDPTSLCDPKGNATRADGRGPINYYHKDDIGSVPASPFRYAPLPNSRLLSSANAPGLRNDMPLSSFSSFFERHASHMMIINGIDVETVSHSVGARVTWSGSIQEDAPSIGALASVRSDKSRLMSFLSYGGYDNTANLIPVTRFSSVELLHELAYPNLAVLSDANAYVLNPAIYERIQQAKQRRLQQQLNTTVLPQRRQALNRLLNTNTNGLEAVISELENLKSILPSRKLSEGLKGQAEVAAAAFASQTAYCANLSMGDFDSHGNHDSNQTFSLTNLVAGIDHLWDMLEFYNLADKTTVIIGSDVGRTPFYNEQFGKDHWNVTSMILMGAGIPGNRLIGATDKNYNALKLDPHTLKVASNQNDANAIKLTPAHIHAALRNHYNIDSQGYSLNVPLLPFFSAT